MAVKILAVDDSVTMRKIMHMTFAGEDAEVVTVGTGQEALTKAKEVRPDVVFADASMSGMDGYAVAHAIKSDASLANTAVIVLASQHNPYDEAKGKNSGVDDHVAKPFDSQVVIDKVVAVLSRPRAKVTGAAPASPSAPVAAAAPVKPAGSPVQGGRKSTGRSPKRTMAFGSAAAAPPPPPPSSSKKKPVLELADEADLVAPAKPKPAAKPKPPVRPAAKPTPAKPAPVAPAAAAATAPGAPLSQKLDALGLSAEQVEGVLALSREVIEQVVWEVVPDMAETLIREEIQRLMSK